MVVIVEAKIEKVPKSVYRLIRSFVDSSRSIKYIWNFGVKIGNMVRFTKFDKWVLKVFMTEEGLSAELEGYGVKVKYDPDILLEVSVGKEIVFRAETPEQVVATCFESDGPYMEPLPLSELIEKFDFYINAVSMLLSKETSIQNNVN